MSETTTENNIDTITVTPFAAENIKQLRRVRSTGFWSAIRNHGRRLFWI